MRKYGLRGSFYASLGLCGTYSSSGEMFRLEDLIEIRGAGHEIGCHTYDHLDAWETRADAFEESIIKNQVAFRELFPADQMRTFAFPRSDPHPKNKAVASSHFVASRGGGQAANKRVLDLNLIGSCFIDQKNRDDLASLLELIERNAREKGWLVFSTHDVGDIISPFGCPREVFEEIVVRTLENGSLVLPLLEACTHFVK